MNTYIKQATTAISAAAAIAFFATNALADAMMVNGPWSRASAGMAGAGAAFMDIMNSSGNDDKLVAAKANISAKVELHTHKMDGDVMRMRKVDFIPLPAGQTTQLKPGGYHVMFLGLKNPLKEGGKFDLTLVFEKAGEKTVTVEVKAPGAMGAMQGKGMEHMDKMEHGKEGMGDMKKKMDKKMSH